MIRPIRTRVLDHIAPRSQARRAYDPPPLRTDWAWPASDATTARPKRACRCLGCAVPGWAR